MALDCSTVALCKTGLTVVVNHLLYPVFELILHCLVSQTKNTEITPLLCTSIPTLIYITLSVTVQNGSYNVIYVLDLKIELFMYEHDYAADLLFTLAMNNLNLSKTVC